jgi:hypothetical protein
MKNAILAVIAVPTLLALLAIAGCGGGGGKTQVVTSPWYGDLYGVATQPEDGETGIAISRSVSWIHVFWPDHNYPPPPVFTMTVEKEETANNWGLIHTTKDAASSDPVGGSWWFAPESDFSPGTWYRITITVPGLTNAAVAYFQTAGTRSGTVGAPGTKSPTDGKSYRPAGNGNAVGETSATHTISRSK